MTRFRYIGGIEMILDNMDETMRKLIRTISSNFIRAQKEEDGDITNRNRYLEQASFGSIYLARLLSEREDLIESSRYLLSAAHSYEKAGAINHAIACYDKIIEIGERDFLHKAREGLSTLNRSGMNELDLVTKEDKVAALDSLVWKYPGLTTTRALQYFSEEFDQELHPASVRSYARELEERNRVTIWGGPQGREYHIYPNVVDLATRKGHYGKKTLVHGSVESRITKDFRIKFEKWNYNKEMFILNGTIYPKVVMAVDIEGFAKNLKSFSEPGFRVSAVGILENFQDLAGDGYETDLEENLDVIDSNVLIDGSTDAIIYNRL